MVAGNHVGSSGASCSLLLIETYRNFASMETDMWDKVERKDDKK